MILAAQHAGQCSGYALCQILHMLRRCTSVMSWAALSDACSASRACRSGSLAAMLERSRLFKLCQLPSLACAAAAAVPCRIQLDMSCYGISVSPVAARQPLPPPYHLSDIWSAKLQESTEGKLCQQSTGWLTSKSGL